MTKIIHKPYKRSTLDMVIDLVYKNKNNCNNDNQLSSSCNEPLLNKLFSKEDYLSLNFHSTLCTDSVNRCLKNLLLTEDSLNKVQTKLDQAIETIDVLNKKVDLLEKKFLNIENNFGYNMYFQKQLDKSLTSCIYTKDGLKLGPPITTAKTTFSMAKIECAAWSNLKIDHYLTATNREEDCSNLLSHAAAHSLCIEALGVIITTNQSHLETDLS